MEWPSLSLSLSKALEDRICNEARHSEDEFKEQEDIYYAIALSLSEQDQKGKKSIDKESQSEEYKQLARAQTKEDEHITKAQLEDDEQLAEALQKTMYMESPPHCETENIFQPHPFDFPSEYRICARCKTEIGGGEFLTCMDADWHPECFRCHACNCPITDSKFYISGNRSYHKLCYRKQRLPRCEVCKNFGHHHLSETRGLCLSEVQTVPSISRRPRIGANHQFIDMRTEPCRLIRRCEVTAILVLYGLPRLLTGQILAHEMMHAWLKLNGYRNLSPEVEEGICQVLAYMWLESELYTASGGDAVPSTSSLFSSLPSSSSFSTSLKMGKRSDFEKKCGDFFKHHIEVDASPTYGDGFRRGRQAVDKYGLKSTLKHIRLTGSFP